MLYMHSVVQLQVHTEMNGCILYVMQRAINKIPILSMQTWAEVSCGYINTKVIFGGPIIMFPQTQSADSLAGQTLSGEFANVRLFFSLSILSFSSRCASFVESCSFESRLSQGNTRYLCKLAGWKVKWLSSG